MKPKRFAFIVEVFESEVVSTSIDADLVAADSFPKPLSTFSWINLLIPLMSCLYASMFFRIIGAACRLDSGLRCNDDVRVAQVTALYLAVVLAWVVIAAFSCACGRLLRRDRARSLAWHARSVRQVDALATYCGGTMIAMVFMSAVADRLPPTLGLFSAVFVGAALSMHVHGRAGP